MFFLLLFSPCAKKTSHNQFCELLGNVITMLLQYIIILILFLALVQIMYEFCLYY